MAHCGQAREETRGLDGHGVILPQHPRSMPGMKYQRRRPEGPNSKVDTQDQTREGIRQAEPGTQEQTHSMTREMEQTKAKPRSTRTADWRCYKAGGHVEGQPGWD